MIELKIANLGETRFPIIRPKRGDITLESKSLTPSGFAMDMGGLSPLGKTGVFELIGTPEELASFQTEVWLEKNGAEIILVNAMTSVSFLMGDPQLIYDYEKRVSEILNELSKEGEQIRKKRALELLKGYAAEFQPRLDQKKIELRGFDIKKELYRLPHTVINALALYYGLTQKGTLNQLEELERRGIISLDGQVFLNKVLNQAIQWRIQTHLFYQNEKEIFFASKGEEDLFAKGLFLITQEIKEKLREAYQTLYSLHQAALAFVQGDERAFAERSLHDSSVGNPRPEDEDCLTYSVYSKLELSYTQALALDPVNPDKIGSFVSLKHILGENLIAVKFEEERLDILMRNAESIPNLAIVDSWLDLGSCYSSIGKFEKTIEYSHLALEWLLQNSTETPFTIGRALLHLGNAYQDLGQLKEAKTYYFKASKFLIKINSFEEGRVLLTLYVNLGLCLDKLGEYSEAMKFHQESLELLRLRKDTPNRLITTVLNNIGLTYQGMEKWSDAKKYYKESLKKMKEIYGDRDHPFIANTLNNLGSIYGSLKQPAKQIECFDRALAIYEKAYGGRAHPNIINCLINKAEHYGSKKEFQKTKEYYEQALSMAKEIYGRDLVVPVPQVAKIWNGLGNVYSVLEDHSSALEHLQKALDMRKKIFGESLESSVANSLENIGDALQHSASDEEIDKLERAMQSYQEALALCKRFYEDKAHQKVAELFEKIGFLFIQLKKPQEALTDLEQALVMYQQVYEESDHPSIANCLSGLGGILYTIKDYEKALVQYELAFKIFKRIPDYEECDSVAFVLYKLGEIHKILNQNEEVIVHLEEALKIMRKNWKGEHEGTPLIVDALNKIGNAYLALGKRDEAIKSFREEITIREEISRGKPNQYVVASWNNLGSLYKSFGEEAGARTCYERALEIARQIYHPSSDPQVAVLLANLAYSLLSLKEYSQAINCILEAIEIQTQHHGSKYHMEIAVLWEKMGLIYYSLGKDLLECDLHPLALQKGKVGIICYYHALHIRKEISMNRMDISIAKILQKLGELHQFIGESQKAEDYFNESGRFLKGPMSSNP